MGESKSQGQNTDPKQLGSSYQYAHQKDQKDPLCAETAIPSTTKPFFLEVFTSTFYIGLSNWKLQKSWFW